MDERGLRWFEYSRFIRDRFRIAPSITWGEVATHNHFALVPGRALFTMTAPAIKLHEGRTEDDHFRALGVLNSSTACFWLKQVVMNKGGGGINEGHRGDGWEFFFQFAATKVMDLPMPRGVSAELPYAIDRVAKERAALLDQLRDRLGGAQLSEQLAELRARDLILTESMIALQEELDWYVLVRYGLVPEDLVIVGPDAPPIAFGQRAFEIVLARQVAAGDAETTWFERHGSTSVTEPPSTWPAPYREAVEQRIALIESEPDISLIERPEHKRRWNRALSVNVRRDAHHRGINEP